ncbi:transporter substrate-binding domain-containing protein [Pseudomonas sp. R2-7-07]|uniref:transporter substrate-binding domain-containing protein n=1 Tax=Pseudomonas sp. R2-7-07 TaxID=658641 RepID=UPI000F578149|nr:transporter substrate-binding domain-containing protein [Pseudomonas sp. R2-7-07]AZF49631.1 Hybrid sensory histidine kinase EvgS [Pseudomonas sp. R2-7-07]
MPDFSVACWSVLLVLLFSVNAQARPPALVELLVNAPLTAPHVEFDPHTKAWLATDPLINVAIWSGALPPLHMGFEQDQFEGVTADYLNVVQEVTGLRMKIWRYATRAKAREALEQGQVDMVALHDVSEGQNGAITQSRPYLLNRKVIVRRIGETQLPSADLSGQRLAYVGDDTVGALLHKQYPNATLIQYSNHLNSLASLVYDQADAFWTDAITAEFLIRLLYSNDVYISGDALSTSADINFAVSDRQPQLLAAINSALDAISPADMMRITTRWGLSNNFVVEQPPLNLDAEQTAWLAAHRKVKVLVAGSYAPLTFFDDQDRLQGLGADLLKIVSQRTGLEFEIIGGNSLPNMIKQLEEGQAELIAAVSIGDLRLSPEQYTRPYLISPFVAVSRSGGQIKGLEDLKGKRLAVATGNPLSQWLARYHPEIIQIPVPTAVRGIELLSDGDVDASVHTRFGADYFIKHHFQQDLKIAAVIGPTPARVSMAVSAEDLPLKSIINKVLLGIPPEELKTLSDRWRNHAAPAVSSSWNTYKDDVYKVVGVAIAFVLAFLVWNYYLQIQIKKRRSAELALSDQLAFSKTLIDGSPIALYVRDKAGRLAHCNRAYLEFLQTTPEEVIGKTLLDAGVISPQLSRQYQKIYQDTQHHGEPTFADLEIDVKGRQHRIYHWTLPYQSSAGEFSGVIGGWLDISEREQLMEQLQQALEAADEANDSKSIFLASMSHEIRTPISALIGLIEMLRVRGGTPQQIDENLTVAHQSAQSLLSLIGDILDLSKIEAGAMQPSPRPTQLGEQLRSIHKLFQVNAHNKGLRFDLLLEARDQQVIIDTLMLDQIVANLISNAIKFTQQGFVELSLKQLPDDAATGFGSYLIEVRDSGCGLNEQQKKAIFEPFVQVAPAATISGRSTGLGLSICTRVATLIDARLSVDSQPGKGSCFQLRFTAERSALAPALATIAAPTQTGRSLKILVVEDHAPNRLLLCQQIEYLGHRAVACDNGETALAEWKQAQPPFDLTITDCNMPHMDGYELTRQMRESEQSRALGAHPVFGLTAHAQSHIIQDCLDAGMTQCLFKPLGIEALTQHIGNVSAQVERRESASRVKGSELQKLKALAPEAYASLVNEFITTNRADGARLEQLGLDNEFEKMVSLAHKIKGGAQMAHAVEMVDACVALEASATLCDAPACDQQVKRILSAMQVLEEQLLASL